LQDEFTLFAATLSNRSIAESSPNFAASQMHGSTMASISAEVDATLQVRCPTLNFILAMSKMFRGWHEKESGLTHICFMESYEAILDGHRIACKTTLSITFFDIAVTKNHL
jgi:hypothetical protein